MIRRFAVTVAVTCTVVVVAPSLMASEPVIGSPKISAVTHVVTPSSERSGYIVASS